MIEKSIFKKGMKGVMMKYKGMYFSLISFLLKKPMIRKFGKNKTEESIKKARVLYRQMLENTEDIGSNNPMSGNIYSAYVFMAVCRAGDFCVDDFKEVIVEFLNNKLIAKLRGHFDLNKPKDMKKFSDRMRINIPSIRIKPGILTLITIFIGTVFIITLQDVHLKNLQEITVIWICCLCVAI